jgi:membrane protease subunit HflK
MKRLFFKSPWEQDDQNGANNIFSRNKQKFNFDQLPNFDFNFKLLGYILLGLLALWLSSGIYEVKEGEEAVVMRFGKFVRTSYPGLNYRLPEPIEKLYVEKVNRSRRIELGYRSNESSVSEYNKDITSESMMLTADENILNLNCDVMWHITDLPKFMFNVFNPQETVRSVAQSVIREVISCTPISSALSNQKQEIADKIHKRIQEILDSYNIGIKIEQVQLLKVEPPEQVISAYRDVQTSRADKEREINQAYAYSNDVIPKARGKAAEMLQQAEGYKQEVISRAEGDVKRFNAIFAQYNQNKQVTKDRLMLDVIEEVMTGANKTIVGEGIILPHLQLKSN